MRYRVVSTFRDLKSGHYVEAGAPCPEIDRNTALRLITARCIVEEPEPVAGAASPAAAAPTESSPSPEVGGSATPDTTTRKGRRSRGAARTGTVAAPE